MSIRIQASANDIEITNESGAFFDLSIEPDGTLEAYCDNGKDSWSGDNRCATVRIEPEDAPDALLAITNWIESLNAKES